MKETFPNAQVQGMATLFNDINQQLDFSSCGEEGNSSDTISDDCAAIHCPSMGCRTPRVQHPRSRSNASSSPLQCTSPIPYASWKKLRLCDTPSTPKSLLSKSSQPFSNIKISHRQRSLRFASATKSLVLAPSVNVNPFTPDTVRRTSELQWRSDEDDAHDYGHRMKHSLTSSEEDDEAFLPPKGGSSTIFGEIRENPGLPLLTLCSFFLEVFLIFLVLCPPSDRDEQSKPSCCRATRDLLLQVAMGLKYIHSSGLAHLDIKPSILSVVRSSMDGLGFLANEQDAALVVFTFLHTDCLDLNYSKELFSKGKDLIATRDINHNGQRIDTEDIGDLETDGHLPGNITVCLEDILPLVELQRPGQ
ncbi:hypothetical protein XENOCAPTIV_023654 [Xenoophorus captivus]|uniref:Protein kinase domain-containing protein n=1 Tax=Xenoophorus captivus TaxID=1517983 RepID=A0ABV0RB38_9TELE